MALDSHQILSPPVVATTALAFTVALAWNTAVSRAVASALPAPRGGARAAALYAAAVTLLVILIVLLLNGAGRAWRHLRDRPKTARGALTGCAARSS